MAVWKGCCCSIIEGWFSCWRFEAFLTSVHWMGVILFTICILGNELNCSMAKREILRDRETGGMLLYDS